MCKLFFKLGDSGGPIQYRKLFNHENIFYIVGVTSFGASCGSDIPGVYTRVNNFLITEFNYILISCFILKVSEYLDWIEKVVWPAAISI